MKGKRTAVYLALLCLLIALFIPLTAAADGCPPDNPNCNLEPPQSIEVNPNPLQADGSPVELEAPGALSPQIVPMPLPRRVDPLPLGDTPSFDTLAIDMRYQDPADVSCGVQALGMALSRLGEDAPSSAAILAFLEDNGMMYSFGTGVEELAYAAQSLGYEGSLPFHGWTLEDLREELSAGHPVVVALGNGESTVGHFVTVTGISPDGQWIAFNDPTLGEQVIPTEDFLRLWTMQGNSGVAVRREAPAEASAGYAPWVAFGAALMALISQTPLALRRKGIGGSLDAGASVGPGQAAPGYRLVFRQMPKYEWQEVQEGWQIVPKTVPKMVRKRVQVGWTTETERIPRYKTEQVQDGWTYTYERVATYRTERYIRYWRTEYTNQATFRYIGGRRVFAGYKRVARRVPVYGTRRVFAGWQTQRKRVPNMVTRTVLAGYDLVEKRVPKYGWVEEQDGWTTTTVQIPNMVRKQVQVGTEWRWVLEPIPGYIGNSETQADLDSEAESNAACVPGWGAGEPDLDGSSPQGGVSSGFCDSHSHSFGNCALDGVFMIANGVGFLLVFTGIGTTLGWILLGANAVYQGLQIIGDFQSLIRDEISLQHFLFNVFMNLLDAFPGLGTLSGLFGLMNTCVFDWAFEWSSNSPDNRR